MDNKIGKVLVLSVILSGVGVVFSFVIYCIIMIFLVLFVIVVIGILVGLVMIGFNVYMYEIIVDFMIVCIKVFEVRLNVCIFEKIMCYLRKEYYDRMK